MMLQLRTFRDRIEKAEIRINEADFIHSESVF